MNKAEYLTELMKRDVEMINLTEKDIKSKHLKIIVELKEAERKCEEYEKMYEGDDNRIMPAYIEYEKIRMPVTELEALLTDFKRNLIDHYEQLLIEKQVFTPEIEISLSKSRNNVLKLNETVEIIKGVLV